MDRKKPVSMSMTKSSTKKVPIAPKVYGNHQSKAAQYNTKSMTIARKKKA